MTKLAVTREAGGKAAAAYEYLKSTAVRGQIRPARRLEPRELARTLGISQTPVREALARLFAEGFVEWRKSQGYHSKIFTEAEQRELHEFGLALLTTSMETFRADRSGELLEGLANLDPSHAADADIAAYLACQAEAMYLGLAEATGNAVRVNATRIILERTHFVRLIDLRRGDIAEETLGALRGMGRALLGQDRAAAQRLGRETLLGRIDRMEHLVGEANAHAAQSQFP